ISGSDNNAVYLPNEPVHGFGTLTTSTAGGTSAAIALNEMEVGDGYLRDVAMDPGTPTQVWVVDNANPAKLHLVSTVTGAEIRSITLNSNFGVTNYFGGMQIVPATFSLNGTSVPAGSLLLADGAPNPDRIIAVDPTTGSIIATLTLTKNYDTPAGIYDPVS